MKTNTSKLSIYVTAMAVILEKSPVINNCYRSYNIFLCYQYVNNTIYNKKKLLQFFP